MKEWMCICAVAVLMVSALTGCGASVRAATTAAWIRASKEEASKVETVKKETIKTSEASERAEDAASEEIRVAAGKHHVEVNIKDYGTISAELYGDEVPITVVNFLKLTKGGFYDELTSHRIISGFMIQGGNPLGTGMGGSDQEIKGEFSNNGMENPLSYTRGAISMAHSQIEGSTSPQFFIVHEDSTFLGGDYTCFGYVTEGMKVVDTIYGDTKVEDNNGFVAEASQPVIGSIEVAG